MKRFHIANSNLLRMLKRPNKGWHVFIALLSFNFILAQTDVTTTYLSNADFETTPTGAAKDNTIYDIAGWTEYRAAGSLDFYKLATIAYNSSATPLGTPPNNQSSVTENNTSLLGMKLHWYPNDHIYVEQTINLPAGKYILTWDSHLKQTSANQTSRSGYIIDGVATYDALGTKDTWKNHRQEFTLPSAKAVTIRMGYTKTSEVGGNESPILFVDNIKLQLAAPTITTASKILYFDQAVTQQNFNIVGANLLNDITLTAPTGISLSKYSFTPEEALQNPTITATYNNSNSISDEAIIYTSGSLEGSIPVKALANTIIGAWDASVDINTTTSFPNNYGWAVSTNQSIWNYANSSSGVRYIDNPANYTYNGNPWTGRAMYIRWDGSPNTSATYSYPVFLEACKNYVFSGRYGWNSNASGTSTFSFGINTSPDNTGTMISSGTFTVTDANRLKLYDATLSFAPTVTDVYYLTIQNDKAMLGVVADLDIIESTNETLTVNKSYLFLDNTQPATTVRIAGNALTNSVTLTAPEGVNLSQTTITPEEAQCGVNITVTLTGSRNINEDQLTITSGELTRTVRIVGIVNNLIGNWDANNNIDPSGSIPTTNNWSSTGTVNWVAANLSTVGSIRYFDNPADYSYSSEPFNGRILYLRWDGSHSQTSAAIYALQTTLEAGKSYTFKGKAAWNTNGSAPRLTIGINESATNSGPMYGKTEIITTTFGNLIDGNFNFSVPVSGDYFLTFTSNTESLNAVTDLAIFENEGAAEVHMTIEKPSISLNANRTVKSLIVKPGADLTISNGTSITTESLTLESSAPEGTASILNNGEITVTGTTSVQQYLSAKSGESTSDNWWYLSSPVTGATSGSILIPESGNKFGFYNETNASYPQILTNDQVLEAGKGYLANINTSGVYSFTGLLNDGEIGPITLTRSISANNARGFNLIGNPYPSHIDWNKITGYKTESERNDIRPTVWIRTRTASGAMTFDTFDGEIGTNLGVRGTLSQYIAPLQAFWVKVNTDLSTPTILFNNTLRSIQNQNTSDNRLKAPALNNQQVLRLELNNGINRDETIIATSERSEQGYDFYDSEKMSANSPSIAEIYSYLDSRELVINKLKSINYGTIIPLGFRPGEAGRFEISASEISNMDAYKIMLIDNESNTEVELKSDNSYTFTSDGTLNNNRFTVEFRIPGTITGFDDPLSDLQLIVTKNSIEVKSTDLNFTDNILIYATTGQLLITQPVQGPTTLVTHDLPSGVYVVKINSTSRKISINN